MRVVQRALDRIRDGLTAERLLLVAVLIMQVAVFVRLDRGAPADRDGGSPPAGSAASVEEGDIVARDAEARDQSTLVARPADAWRTPWPAPHRGRGDMFREMDAMFESMWSDIEAVSRFMEAEHGWRSLAASPTMDMREDEDDYIVMLSLPGIDPDTVRVMLEDRILTVQTGHDPGIPYQVRGRGLRRRVQLPGPVGAPHLARAVLTNGFLKVSVPKAVPTGAGIAVQPASHRVR